MLLPNADNCQLTILDQTNFSEELLLVYSVHVCAGTKEEEKYNFLLIIFGSFHKYCSKCLLALWPLIVGLVLCRLVMVRHRCWRMYVEFVLH